MPGAQIQAKWNSWSERDFGLSIQALQQYDPEPEITASIKLKGKLPLEALKQIAAIGREFDLEPVVTVTGTWPKDDTGQMHQLCLFGPGTKHD